MAKVILAEAKWDVLIKTMQTEFPEMFDKDNNLLNCVAGTWQWAGHGKVYLSPVDGSLLGKIPMLSADEGEQAVVAAANEFETWKGLSLAERKQKITNVLAALRKYEKLLAYLLTWEIGKPVKQSMVSVDRCITGVEWYIQEIDGMMGADRNPLGLISNIASWNYPMSVLVHAMLIQALCGNSVIAKVPTDGGLYTLSIAIALARREGLPFTLISGAGSELSHALIQQQDVTALNYVGGKSHGKGIALSLVNNNKRHMLEMEGVNAYGIWNYSNWADLAAQIKKGYEYGKQRCTAYARWVIQRELFPQFLEMYLSVIKTIKIGHPLLVNEGDTTPPDIDFGSLINYKKVEELMGYYNDALSKGGTVIYKGNLDKDAFLPNQDKSAYLAPIALLGLPKNSHLYYNEPFGPIDTFILVDSVEELVTEMNVSNGNLVSSIATDDVVLGAQISSELRAFKTGINKVRSRGDKDEPFGGKGQSWKGYFVGGKYLVYAITSSANDTVHYGNFGNQVVFPEGI
jgi:acyl-CoA reductase-like NAD-dependent aldehyde dehydrogenase